MKTEWIKKLIGLAKEAAASLGDGLHVSLVAEILVAQKKSKAELAAIETQMAGMREALGQAIAAIQNAPPETWGAVQPTMSEEGWWIRDEMVSVFSKALTGTPQIAVLSLEELKGLEWVTDDETIDARCHWCPSCKSLKGEGHRFGCGLAAKIKQAEGGGR